MGMFILLPSVLAIFESSSANEQKNGGCSLTSDKKEGGCSQDQKSGGCSSTSDKKEGGCSHEQEDGGCFDDKQEAGCSNADSHSGTNEAEKGGSHDKECDSTHGGDCGNPD